MPRAACPQRAVRHGVGTDRVQAPDQVRSATWIATPAASSPRVRSGPCGWLTSGGWGYTVGKSIGYGCVRSGNGVSDDFLYGGTYELEVADERVPCTMRHGPLHDPEMNE